MATIIPDEGVDNTEPTMLAPGALQDTKGAEYRVGQRGLYVARGREKVGDLGSLTGKGVYEAGFDSSAGFVVAHEGNSLHSAPIASALTFTLIDNLPVGSSAIVGSHYAGRHYAAFGTANRKFEKDGIGITSLPIGMSKSTYTVGVSVTQGAGLMDATTGLEYWVTEYDPVRGIESVFGSTANTGAISSLDGVVVSVTGSSANSIATKLRWYRSTDGGGYPDGGLIRTTDIYTGSIVDRDILTGSLTVPQYGVVSVGGLDTDRDEVPPVMSIIFGPFGDSLLGVNVDEPRVLRFTPAGYPDSWPSQYGIPLETARQDFIVAGAVLPGRIGTFCNDSVHVVYRLPRDSDSIFAAGEAQDEVTTDRGCMSRRGAVAFTPPGSGSMVAWVARDGIWTSNLATSIFPLTDSIDWTGKVSVENLFTCRLVDDPINRRLVFIHRKKTDTTHNTGIWYLDYQQFSQKGIRITFADHGPLADAVTIAAADGHRRLVSIDSRASNGQVYIEANQDKDDSLLADANGSVGFKMWLKEFMPAGARGTVSLGKASWMHDAGPARIEHRFYANRDPHPEVKEMKQTTIRTASTVGLQKNVNSLSLEIESAGTKSYGVHWIDIEGFDVGQLGGREGA